MDKCRSCQFYDYDEEWDDWVCTADMDEDEYARLRQRGVRGCPWWRRGGEEGDYRTARRQ